MFELIVVLIVCNTVVYLIDWRNLSLKRGAIKMNCYHFATNVFSYIGSNGLIGVELFFALSCHWIALYLLPVCNNFFFYCTYSENYALICAIQLGYEIYRAHAIRGKNGITHTN